MSDAAGEQIEQQERQTGAMIALVVPPAVASALAVEGGERPEDLHLTLIHFEDAQALGQPGRQRVLSAALEMANCWPPVAGEISGPGLFAKDGVLYASYDSPALPSLRQCLAERLQCLGVPFSTSHGFTPHITLRYGEATDALPAVAPRPLTFRQLVVAFGDERQVFDLTGQEARVWYGLSMRLEPEAIQLSGDKVVSTIQVARVGQWDHPKFGLFEFSPEIFAAFIRNFDAGVTRTDICLNFEHSDMPGAAGWFVPGTMRTEGEGAAMKLLVDVQWTPQGAQAIRDEVYKYVSLEFFQLWTDDETGAKIPYVITACAITVDPFVKGMATVQSTFPMRLSARAVLLSDFEEKETRKMKRGKSEDPSPTKTDDNDGDEPKGEQAELSTKQCLDDEEEGSMDMSDLVAQHDQLTKQIISKAKGKGAPMVRQHLAASHKLLGSYLSEGAPKTMSTPQSEEVMQLSQRLAQLEDQAKNDKFELSRLKAEKRRSDVIALTSAFFPRQGVASYRLQATSRDQVVALAQRLSELDEERDQVAIKLSAGAALDDSSRSNLLRDFLAVLAAVPETKINLSSHVALERDGEADGMTERERVMLETQQLADKENISFADAALKLSAKRASAPRRA